MRGTESGPSLWVPGIEVARDSEKQGQHLVEVMGMISDREGGREVSRRLGSWGRGD